MHRHTHAPNALHDAPAGVSQERAGLDGARLRAVAKLVDCGDLAAAVSDLHVGAGALLVVVAAVERVRHLNQLTLGTRDGQFRAAVHTDHLRGWDAREGDEGG